MIFAKLDVVFDVHPKFVQLAKAGRLDVCGYWCAVLTHLRRNDSRTGIIPMAEIGMPLHVGDEKARELCERLVEYGLFEAKNGGYLLLRYSEKNETADAIEKRRSRVRARVAKHRGKSGNAVTGSVTHGVTSSVTEDVTSPVTVTQCTGSDSDSDSGSGSGSDPEEEREMEPTGLALLPPDDIPLTPELVAKCQMAGTREPTRTDVLECLTNARKKGHIRADWNEEFFSWMLRSKRFDAASGVRRVADSAPDIPSRKRIEPLPKAGTR